MLSSWYKILVVLIFCNVNMALMAQSSNAWLIDGSHGVTKQTIEQYAMKMSDEIESSERDDRNLSIEIDELPDLTEGDFDFMAEGEEILPDSMFEDDFKQDANIKDDEVVAEKQNIDSIDENPTVANNNINNEKKNFPIANDKITENLPDLTYNNEEDLTIEENSKIVDESVTNNSEPDEPSQTIKKESQSAKDLSILMNDNDDDFDFQNFDSMSMTNDISDTMDDEDTELAESDDIIDEETSLEEENGKSEESINANRWTIEKRKNIIPKQKKHLLPSSVYRDKYDENNDHLAPTIYDGDYKKWFLEALLDADLPLISYLVDLFNIDLDEPVVWNLKPIEVAEKMQNKELKRLLMVKNSKMHTSEFNEKYYLDHKPSVILFDWNDTLVDAIEGSYAQEKDEKLFEGAVRFLNYLKEQGIKLGVVSNENNMILRAALKRKKIDHFFDLIMGGGDTVFFKPAPELGNYIVEQFGGLDENPYIWMVGDSDRDLKFALNSNFMPIGFKNSQLFKGYLNFDNYADFQKWFKKHFDKPQNVIEN